MTTKNIFIAGQTGSGKSYHVKNQIIPNLDERFKIIVDYKNEYTGNYACISNMTSPDKYGEIYHYCKEHRIKTMVIKINNYDPDLLVILFQYLNDVSDKILIFDEASFFFEDLKRGDIPFEVKRFFRSSTLPHNKNHNVILITQSPQDIPKIILGQFQEGLIFNLKPFQLEYLYHNAFIPEKEYDFSKPYTFYKV